MLTNDERDQLRVLEKNLIRDDPEFAAKFGPPVLAEPRFSRWAFLLVLLGGFAGTAMIIVGVVDGWAAMSWAGTVLAIGVPIVSFQRSRR